MSLFKATGAMTVVGCTGSGKTMWTLRLLKNLPRMYDVPPAGVLYCYGIWQDLYEDIQNLPGVEMVEGLPSKETLEGMENTLIVLDDLVHRVVADPEMEVLFTQKCHHQKLSVIMLTQNAFQSGKHARTITLNNWYMVLFENVRDRQQVASLGRQLFPGKQKGFMKAYDDATSEPYGYLVIDTSPQSRYRLRTRVFPGEDPVVYTLH